MMVQPFPHYLETFLKLDPSDAATLHRPLSALTKGVPVLLELIGGLHIEGVIRVGLE